jgi:FkbM family methyltransferase
MNHFKSTFLGKKIFLSDKCNSIWGASRSGEIYDSNLIRSFFNRINFQGDRINFFDIGANTGSFIFYPLLNKKIKCFAFEPNPLAFEALKENITLNGLDDNVESFNLGMWSEKKILELKVPIDTQDSGLATLGDSPSRFKYDKKSGDYNSFSVNCETIDGLMVSLKLSGLDLLKIDTEGAELSILKGGEKTLSRFKPPILLEYDDKNTKQFGYEKEDIIELLKSYGYSNFTLLAPSDLYASFKSPTQVEKLKAAICDHFKITIGF